MRSVTALELLERSGRTSALHFSCPLLTEATGGLLAGTVTEVVGEAGSGKTQLALDLSLHCYLDESSGGLNGSCAYICTNGEGEFPIRRLSQIAQVKAEEMKKTPKYVDVTSAMLLENVHIEACRNIDDCLFDLKHKIPLMCVSNRLKLLVIDSVAGLLCLEYDSSSREQMKERTRAMFRLAQSLKWLASTFDICVVVLNQVRGKINQMPSSLPSREWEPALGLAWSHCINSRIVLMRDTRTMRSTGEDDKENSGDGNAEVAAVPKAYSRRTISLELSPWRPLQSASYEITGAGIRGVDMSL